MILLTVVITRAQTTTSPTPTFVIANLLAPEEEEGMINVEPKHNAHIEVKLKNVTQRKAVTSFFIYCLEEPNTFPDFSYLELVGKTNGAEGSTEDSFVEIHNIGDANIERVEFVMESTGTKESFLVSSASIDGINYFNSDYENESGKSIYKRITSEGSGSDICNSSYSYDVPNLVEDVWGDTGDKITNAREKLKYVRLNWGKNFAGASSSNRGSTTNIYAIKVYTDADITVGITEEQKTIDVQLFGRNLQLSEIADVYIYDIAGKIVAQYNDVDNAYLNYLNNGVYIIKTLGSNGQQSTQKVVVR